LYENVYTRKEYLYHLDLRAGMENYSIIKKGTSLKFYTFSFLMRYKIYLTALATTAIIASILEISVSYKIKEIIDTIASSHDVHLEFLLLLFVLYKLMFHGVQFIAKLFEIRYRPRIVQQVVADIYLHTVQHSLHWFDSHLSGEISNKIADFQVGISTLMNAFFRALNNVATIIISVWFLFHINVASAVVLGIFICIYTPVIYVLMKKQLKIGESVVHAKQEVIGVINDSIANMFAIKSLGSIWTEFSYKLTPAIVNWRKLSRKNRQFDAYVVDSLDALMVTIMSAVQIYLLAYLYRSDIITAGDFAFVAVTTLNIHTELDKFLERLLTDISPNVAQVRSSYAFVTASVDVQDKQHAVTLEAVQGEIQFKDVYFAYGKGERPVLSDFNVHIKAGQKVGIVGTSGTGKTTLVKCLLRYFDVQAGEILIDGHSIADVTQDSLRKAISIIPQDIGMLHRSVRENLQLAKHDATEAEIIAACKQAKIYHDIMTMRDGFNTVVGERGVKLSGGQRQRIAIARAILKDAPILILDEATSNLDSQTEQLIQDSLQAVLATGNTTVIAIAHRLSTLKNMDRILVIDQGKIIQEGTHEELVLKYDGMYKKLWDMQVNRLA
jgi:ATP-binding cassette subfamily B protein